MVSALDLRRVGREFEGSHVPSVVSLGKILYSSSVFLRPGVREKKGELFAGESYIYDPEYQSHSQAIHVVPRWMHEDAPP